MAAVAKLKKPNNEPIIFALGSNSIRKIAAGDGDGRGRMPMPRPNWRQAAFGACFFMHHE
jgi:hypothetical protein